MMDMFWDGFVSEVGLWLDTWGRGASHLLGSAQLAVSHQALR